MKEYFHDRVNTIQDKKHPDRNIFHLTKALPFRNKRLEIMQTET